MIRICAPTAALAMALSLMLPACKREADAPVQKQAEAAPDAAAAEATAAAPSEATTGDAAATAAPSEATTGDAAATAAPPKTMDAKGDTPTLSVNLLSGELYDLASRRGRWVVINFWATWCAPCVKEMPELDAYDAKRDDLDVVGLAYEEITPEDMRAFLDKRPVNYPIAILDVYDPPPAFGTPRGLPMTYLIAPDGRIAERFMGPVTGADLDAAIELHLHTNPGANSPAAAASSAGAALAGSAGGSR
jgi:thiol-disulfide isomerase/thioredoxin